MAESASSAADDALWMIGVMEADLRLDAKTRRDVSSLRSMAARSPELACKRLEEIARNTAASLPRRPPRQDLAKCTGLEDFYEHYLDSDIRAYFITAEDYRRRLEASENPRSIVFAELSSRDPLIPSVHSWMAPRSDITSLDARQTRKALAIRGQPPLVVLLLGLASMLACGITVRTPCAVDAVPKRLREWSPSGLSSGVTELIDSDIPRQAVSEVDWRA